ncbi:MAG: AraC family transcriptional regulator [Herbinix sp.]|nr:AraC family transcriptional regulator [Herbinix sp.]
MHYKTSRSELKENRIRGTQLFPFQHYKMTNHEANIFVPYHWHNEIEIIYVERGTVKLLLNGEEYLLTQNNFYFINREALHQFSSEDKELVYYAYVFPMEYLDFKLEDYCQSTTVSPLTTTLAFPLTIPSSNANYKKILSEIHELFEISEQQLPGYQLNAKACLYKIISILQRDNSFVELSSGDLVRSSKTADMKKLLTYLQANYKNPMTLADAALMLGYSTAYFCTFFKNSFGINFVDYLNHYRIEKSCILLVSTKLPVMEIAFEVGFKNFSYFIRTFKKIMHMTPLEYRRSNQLDYHLI